MLSIKPLPVHKTSSFIQGKSTYISVSAFLFISSFLSAPPLLSIFCSSFLSFKICSQSGSACDSLSLCVAFAPANRFARYPGPGRIGFVHDRHKKRHSFECPFYIYQQLPILPGRFQPSTFGVCELNFRVRHGYGWCLTAIATESLRVCSLKTI